MSDLGREMNKYGCPSMYTHVEMEELDLLPFNISVFIEFLDGHQQKVLMKDYNHSSHSASFVAERLRYDSEEFFRRNLDIYHKISDDLRRMGKVWGFLRGEMGTFTVEPNVIAKMLRSPNVGVRVMRLADKRSYSQRGVDELMRDNWMKDMSVRLDPNRYSSNLRFGADLGLSDSINAMKMDMLSSEIKGVKQKSEMKVLDEKLFSKKRVININLKQID